LGVGQGRHARLVSQSERKSPCREILKASSSSSRVLARALAALSPKPHSRLATVSSGPSETRNTSRASKPKSTRSMRP
jgi:hypothetical protein